MTKEIQNTTAPTDPPTEFDRALDSLRERFYDTFGFVPFGLPYATAEPSELVFFRPARADVSDTGKTFRIVAEVPGIPKDKLDIRVRGTSVEIRGESVKETEEKGTEYVHRERAHAGYQRSFELPEPVLASQAKVTFENGVLELELPKEHPTASPEEIKVPVP